MPTPNITLGNPFVKENPLNKPLVTAKPKQTPPNYGRPANFGNVTVSTKNPVLVQPVKPTQTEVAQQVDDKKVGFWASKTKKQKVLIATGAIVVVAVSYLLLKRK